MAGSQKIKFPVLKNVEYFDIIQNKTVIKTFTQDELENKTWRQVQELVGKYATGSVHYTFKFINNPETHKGLIRSINKNFDKDPGNGLVNKLVGEIEDLKIKLNAAGSGSGVTVDLLMSITKQSYETQITFLNNEVNRKDILIAKLETTIDKLNDEISSQDETISKLQSKSGLTQYLPLITSFLNKKIPGLAAAEKITTLKDSNTSDVPGRILELIGAVDWQRVDEKIITEIINYMEIFLNQLPLKG